MSRGPQRLDGNVAAGPLATVLAFEVTTARCTCAACGATEVFAELHVYTDAPGMVVRCPSCQAVVLRLAETPGHTWVDMRGAGVIDVATAE
jgi:NAD-dependent SIR2 family protein deacetylase